MDIDISNFEGLTQDSRAVKSGYLFAAFEGEQSDGRDFIPDAITRGATAILAGQGTTLPETEKSVTLFTDENPRRTFAKLAAKFYASQPEHIVAVTGTNGKTSVVTFVEQLWAAAGYKSASLGTLKGTMTTLDAVALHKQLADLAKSGITHLALEASSHGLDQYRLDGVEIEAAGFTNLSHDHLDYHGDMDKYFDAKSRLFSEVMKADEKRTEWTNLNADIANYSQLETLCKQRGLKTMSYGRKAKDIKLLSIKPTADGQELELGVLGKHINITLPLVGEFQAMNALCALGLVLAQDPENKAHYLDAMEKLEGAAGRLQRIGEHPKGASVYVDYAHTPDALENILTALRPHTNGKLVCIFGCGGDRDKEKRSIMGAVSNTYADVAIITDDNPRSETPAEIRAEILKSAPKAQEIASRRTAIHQTIQSLEEGDVLVIAGKGHEQGQIFADHTDPFDDAEEAQNAIKNLTESIT